MQKHKLEWKKPKIQVLEGSFTDRTATAAKTGAWIATAESVLPPSVASLITAPEKPKHATNTAKRRESDAITATARASHDFVVWRKIGDRRVFCGLVRKDDGGICYRKATDNGGLGSLHVLPKRRKMPADLLTSIFGRAAYMQPMREYLHNREWHARHDTRAAAPHDRRPQMPMLQRKGF